MERFVDPSTPDFLAGVPFNCVQGLGLSDRIKQNDLVTEHNR
jgi:hypothetical protein